jgi:hypothetical protein
MLKMKRAILSSLNPTRLKHISTRQWGVLMFVFVCLFSGLLVIKETPSLSYPVVSLLGKLNIGVGADQPPVSLASTERYLNDNYNRCQNKLGLELPLLDGNVLIQGDYLNQQLNTMQQMYLSGMRYVLLRIDRYGQFDQQNLQTLVRAAYDHHLVPVVVPEKSPTGAGSSVAQNSDALFNLYTKVAGNIGTAYFIASTSSREFLNLGKYTETVAIASDLAHRLRPYRNITIATPPMFVDTDKQIEQATWLKDSGLLLKDFDIMLLMMQNSETTYEDHSQEFYRTAYYRYSSVGYPEGTRFAPKQWIRDENDANKYFQRAIIMNFGAAQGTVRPGDKHLVDRLAYDFGYFSDDPTVDAVIFANGFEGGPLSYADYAKINLAGTNCNYDLVDYQTKYDDKSVALACDQKVGTNNTGGDKTSAKIVCSGLFCQTQINYTIQVGLPIRSMGSNSAVGTNTSPYMPACARAAITAAVPYYDFLNQFAGKLQSSDGKTYMVPWLGNGINCALAAKVKFFNAQSLFEANANFSLGATVNQAAGELASELALDGGIYPGPSLWAWVAGKGQKTKYTDERVIYSGKDVGIDKTYVQAVDSLGYYDPQANANTFEQSMACGGEVQRVKTDPQNMVYGGQQIIDTDKWLGTPQELCFQYWSPKNGDVYVDKVGKGINCRIRQGLNCTCDQSPNKQLPMTETAIRNGLCGASDEMKTKCIELVGGASDAASSGVALVSKRFSKQITQNVPKYNIPGAYDALASVYKLVQDKLAERNQKLVLNEKWGWKSDVILRAYADVPGGNINGPRKSQLLENSSRPVPADLPLSAAAGSATGPKGASNQCKVGVNFAIPYSSLDSGMISEAVNVGYGYGQVIIYDGGNPGDVTNKLNQMCSAGITPVLRSCTIGQCGFGNGTNQGNFLKAAIGASSCKEVYAVCGHNEPVPENPNGMVDEGRWTKDCVNAIGSDSKIKLTTPIFNATYDDGSQKVTDHVADFMKGYGNFAADKGRFACVAFNTYDNNGGDFPTNKADVYYDRVMNIPAFSGMQACVMETGDFLSNSTGALTGLINRLEAKSNLIFLLGFDWTGTNPDPAWSRFVIPDKGKAAVGAACAGGAGSMTFGQTGDYYTYNQYEADGNNFYEVNQYYSMMGLYDELNRIYDVLAAQDVLPSGVIKVNSGSPIVEADSAEYFAGLPGCNSDVYKKIVAQTGEAVNCIGTIKDTDPLGDFLCEKGYAVSDQCVLQCKVSPSTTTPNTANFCPMKGGKCLEGPNTGTHSSLASAVDLIGSGTIVAPFDGQIVAALNGTNFNRCKSNLAAGGGIIYQGTLNGQTTTLFFYHVRVGGDVVAGKTYKAGETITTISRRGDSDLVSDGNSCWEGEHLHMEAVDNDVSTIQSAVQTGSTTQISKAMGSFLSAGSGVDHSVIDLTSLMGCNMDASIPSCKPTGSLPNTTISCEIPVDSDIKQGSNCNEWNCGGSANNTFRDSLRCASTLAYLKNLTTDRWVDRYGPYCDNETRGLPFGHNLFGLIYDKYLPPGTPGGRLCGELPPDQKHLRPGDETLRCNGNGPNSPMRQPGDPGYDYYRGALIRCPLPQAQAHWTAQNTFGLTPEALADKMMREIVYQGIALKNTPRDKVIAVLKQAQLMDLNPYILVGMWGTESAFGQSRPECNVY